MQKNVDSNKKKKYLNKKSCNLKTQRFTVMSKFAFSQCLHYANRRLAHYNNLHFLAHIFIHKFLIFILLSIIFMLVNSTSIISITYFFMCLSKFYQYLFNWDLLKSGLSTQEKSHNIGSLSFLFSPC